MNDHTKIHIYMYEWLHEKYTIICMNGHKKVYTFKCMIGRTKDNILIVQMASRKIHIFMCKWHHKKYRIWMCEWSHEKCIFWMCEWPHEKYIFSCVNSQWNLLNERHIMFLQAKPEMNQYKLLYMRYSVLDFRKNFVHFTFWNWTIIELIINSILKGCFCWQFLYHFYIKDCTFGNELRLQICYHNLIYKPEIM